MTIRHISDTARWVAVYRALESERPDALFHDPYARRLAGELGERIVDELPRGRSMAWSMIVRTAVMDEIITDAVASGVDLVVNLAAGLDARPWRLDLPVTLRWVDMDLPGVLDYKLEALQAEMPRCAYEAVRVDLTDEEARRAALAEVGRSARRALVLTEGLLIYLTRQQVASLSVDLHNVPSLHTWIIDLTSPWLLKMISRSWGGAADQGDATFQFAPEEGTAFFEPHGWRETAYRGLQEEGRRLHREMRGAWFWRLMRVFMSRERRETMRRISGVVVLERMNV